MMKAKGFEMFHLIASYRIHLRKRREPGRIAGLYMIQSVMACINQDQSGSDPVLSGHVRLMLAASRTSGTRPSSSIWCSSVAPKCSTTRLCSTTIMRLGLTLRYNRLLGVPRALWLVPPRSRLQNFHTHAGARRMDQRTSQ